MPRPSRRSPRVWACSWSSSSGRSRARTRYRPATVHPPGIQRRKPVDQPPVLRLLRIHLPGAAVPPAGARGDTSRRRTVLGPDDVTLMPSARVLSPRLMARIGAAAGCLRGLGSSWPVCWSRPPVAVQLLLADARRSDPARCRHGAGDDAGHFSHHRGAAQRTAGCRLRHERSCARARWCPGHRGGGQLAADRLPGRPCLCGSRWTPPTGPARPWPRRPASGRPCPARLKQPSSTGFRALFGGLLR